MSLALQFAERGWLPDGVVRWGIRQMCDRRLRNERAVDPDPARARATFAAFMATGPIAPVPHRANEQHYEVPAAFFEIVLGPWLKYSCGLWPDGVTTLDDAEERMLALTVERAGIGPGMRVLDLGCGWGALTRYIARHVPDCEIVAVSNSAPQRSFIEQRCVAEGLGNVTVLTADANTLKPMGVFDRVCSVEMFEHLRNYGAILERVRKWLAPGGRMFIHIFCHRERGYAFQDQGAADWMGRHFFTGGIMPAWDVFEHFRNDLIVEERWCVSGDHYARTSNAWLERMDRQQSAVRSILAPGGEASTAIRYQRWRMFFMACAELFAYDGGREWHVGHYRLKAV